MRFPPGLLALTVLTGCHARRHAQPDRVSAQPDSVPAQPDSVPAQPDSVPAQPDRVPSHSDTVPAQPDTVPAQPDSLRAHPDSAVATARAARTAPVAGALPDAPDLQVLIPMAVGAVRIEAVHREGRRLSEIIATRFDADGRSVGAARTLRQTTGPIASLAASARGAYLWVAWIAQRVTPPDDPAAAPDTEEDIVVVMRASQDLERVEAPIVLDDFRRRWMGRTEANGWRQPVIMVVALETGGVDLVATGPMSTCVHEDGSEHASRAPCAGWYTGTVGAHNEVSIALQGTLAPNTEPYAMTRVHNGFAYVYNDDHPGTKHIIDVEADVAARGEVLFDQHDVHLAWTGSELVSTQVPEGSEPPAETIRVERRDGTVVTPTHEVGGLERYPVVANRRAYCAAGHPVVTLRWAGGAVTLDPTLPDASMDLRDWITAADLPLPTVADAGAVSPSVDQLAWTGRALLGVVAGRPARWVCGPTAPRLVYAP